MANTGRDYERFVAGLQQAILNAESLTNQKNVQVERNKKIVDNCGIEREFDLYWEYEFGGLVYRTVIECKDYASPVSVEKIDALVGKLRDLPGVRGVFATKTGYQSGAKTKAEANKIDLLIVREQNDSDWTSESGEPLVKSIHIDMRVRMPAAIHKFAPLIDGKWVRETNRDPDSVPLNYGGRNDQIFIEDVAKGETYSIRDLASRLSPLNEDIAGTFSKRVELQDAFLRFGEERLKIAAYDIEYTISPPFTEKIVIDFSKELIGVIEYLQKGTKKSVFRDGVIR